MGGRDFSQVNGQFGQALTSVMVTFKSLAIARLFYSNIPVGLSSIER